MRSRDRIECRTKYAEASFLGNDADAGRGNTVEAQTCRFRRIVAAHTRRHTPLQRADLQSHRGHSFHACYSSRRLTSSSVFRFSMQAMLVSGGNIHPHSDSIAEEEGAVAACEGPLVDDMLRATLADFRTG